MERQLKVLSIIINKEETKIDATKSSNLFNFVNSINNHLQGKIKFNSTDIKLIYAALRGRVCGNISKKEFSIKNHKTIKFIPGFEEEISSQTSTPTLRVVEKITEPKVSQENKNSFEDSFFLRKLLEIWETGNKEVKASITTLIKNCVNTETEVQALSTAVSEFDYIRYVKEKEVKVC